MEVSVVYLSCFKNTFSSLLNLNVFLCIFQLRAQDVLQETLVLLEGKRLSLSESVQL